LEAFILQGKIKILFLCNYCVEKCIRIMSVRDFPPEKVDKLIIYLFLFRDIDDIPKIFFHKNFFNLIECFHRLKFKLHPSNLKANIKYLKLLREFMKNLYHFLVNFVYLFIIKVFKVLFFLGLNLHEFIKFVLIFFLVLYGLCYYVFLNHFYF
jgi:hypothetical protein